MIYNLRDDIVVCQPQTLYKWARVWGSVQKKYYQDRVFFRREKQIQDFVFLNQFKKIYVEKDTDILHDIVSVHTVDDADLVIITDQKFSRRPCQGIIAQIDHTLSRCSNLLLCLNRHYINIDNSYHDADLDDNLNLAITQWLRKNLVGDKILDLSLDYLDHGDWFTWVIPDRIYFIQRPCT